MNKDENKNSVVEQPATLPDPGPGEEELKDYSNTSEEDLLDNMPDAHPEPSPAKNT